MEVFVFAGVVVAAIAGVAGWVRARGRANARRVETTAQAETTLPDEVPTIEVETFTPSAEVEPPPTVAPADDDLGDLTVMMRRQS